MKKIIFILSFVCACLVLTSCLQGGYENSVTDNNENVDYTNDEEIKEKDEHRKDGKEKYTVEGLDRLEEWVKRKDKKVLPNNLDKEITTEDDEFGDLSHLIDKISSNGYFSITSNTSTVSINECSLYDDQNVHDMLFNFEVISDNSVLNLPCYITYIPEEYIAMAEKSPVECIMAVRDITLYDKNSPLIVNDEKLIREVKQITVGGNKYTAVVQEYIDSKYTGKLGAIFIIVENMIVQIQKPYSNTQILQALENIDFEVISVSSK